MPPFLRWWHPVSGLPPIFHQMDLGMFERLIKFLTTPGMVSGLISHPTLLALGLIYQEMLRSQVFGNGGTEPVVDTQVNSEYYDFYATLLRALKKRVLDTAAANALAFPAACTTDKIGYTFADTLPEIEAEEGSPLAAGRGTRSAALKYLTTLSELQVFRNAVGTMNKVIIFAWY